MAHTPVGHDNLAFRGSGKEAGLTSLSWPANAGHPGESGALGRHYFLRYYVYVSWMAHTPVGHDKLAVRGSGKEAGLKLCCHSRRAARSRAAREGTQVGRLGSIFPPGSPSLAKLS